ncbi:MAG: hypothetical protein R3Y23_03930 [Bacillota bacterium]
MSEFQQYCAILKAIRKNKPVAFDFLLRNDKNKKEETLSLEAEKAPVKKIFGIIAIVIFSFIALAYFFIMCGTSAISALQSGVFVEYLYMMVLSVQIMVLFLGVPAGMSFMYYSKDNTLLSSLPIKKQTLFLARLTLTYLSQLVLAGAMVVIVLGSSGVAVIIAGAQLPWSYFLVMVGVALLVPVLPLLVVSLLALPIMYLVSWVKKSKIATAISLGFVIVVAVGLYMTLIITFASNSSGEDLALGQGTIDMYNAIMAFTIFNKPIVDALIGTNVALNSLLYIGVLLIIGIVAVAVSALMYGRAMAIVSEGSSKSSAIKKAKEPQYKQQSLVVAMVKKDFKMLTSTPMLLVSTLMFLVISPIIIYFYSIMFQSDNGVDDAMSRAILQSISVFMAFMITMVANQLAMVGFSLEGKSLPTLKCLPIASAEICKSKLISASILTAVSIVVSVVSIAVILKTYNIVFILGIIALLAVGGYGMNCFALTNDMKNPNMSWTNVNELTKNNTRIIVPVLIGICCAIVVLVLGILTAVFAGDVVPESAIYAIWFGSMLIIITPFTTLAHKRYFKNSKIALEKIEG